MTAARLDGGPLDGLIVRGVDVGLRPRLLMPTNRDAVYGEAPPTHPYFAEYVHAGQFDMHLAVYTFAGVGVTIEAEDVTEAPPTRKLNPLFRPALPRGLTP